MLKKLLNEKKKTVLSTNVLTDELRIPTCLLCNDADEMEGLMSSRSIVEDTQELLFWGKEDIYGNKHTQEVCSVSWPTPTCSAYTHVFDPYMWLEEWPARFEKERQR